MNKIELLGRLTKDVNLTYTQGENTLAIAKFSVAVPRKSNKEVDFINCVSFGKTAEFLSKYFIKGQMICLVGRLQIDNYEDKDGNKRTSANVIIEEVDFCGDKKSNSETNIGQQNIDTVEYDLPF